ncbi:MAG: undecaprenyldiphospho-muramoylpentapeptide beta-N-acetylglucosaminyltransferase [Oligoflexia bacterium]|nr:undecaprenyldiphospho-muramoylpentapeptide beta-N-acetylglucosaminyltransferase [Oligoflexia bacterium]
MARKGLKLLVAGGGTGGHVLAGVAVADAWKKQPDASVLFVGAHGGIEEKLVPRAGYELQLLKLGSLNRVSLAKRLRTLVLLPLSLVKSCQILLREKPDAVLGVGGYASGPIVLCARVLSALGLIRAKTAILEQNSVPGMTNRLLGRVVDTVFCAFPGTEGNFPKQAAKQAVFLTGNPVRSAMRRFAPASADPFTVFIFGGSQGAAGINTLVINALPFLLSRQDLKGRLHFIHQTGENDFERVRAAHEKAGSSARVEKFIHDMADCYEKASLLICRSGSSTLSEVAAVGRASILVPFPFASDNHQEMNARTFSDREAAFLMLQGTSSGEELARRIRECFDNPEMLRQMEGLVAGFYRPDAAQDIVQELSRHA